MKNIGNFVLNNDAFVNQQNNGANVDIGNVLNNKAKNNAAAGNILS